jgi:ribosome-associated protein
MKTIECAKIAASAASDKLGVDIVALDVKPLTSLAEVFLFVGATSHVHVRALEDAIREKMAQDTDINLIRTDGQRGHLWRVLDFGSLLVHIMEQKTREFYAVERLWNAAKRVPVLGNEVLATTEPEERRHGERRTPRRSSRRAPTKKKKKVSKRK